jgi:hypothetical protein
MRRQRIQERAPSTVQPGEQLSTLRRTVSTAHPGVDLRPIEHAYAVAAQMHRGQRRKSGDPYITHPVAVATIVAELGMSPEIICAALLHDTIEDTPYTLAQLREEFGEEIASLVDDGICRPNKLELEQAVAAVGLNADCATISQSHEVGVLVLRLADRLHNMRTMRYLPPDMQKLKSRQTLHVHVPVAHLLGMDTIGCELRDLASAILYRELFNARPVTVAERMLAASAMILPPTTRGRWLEEWAGELSALPTRRARARFAVHTLRGMPRLAVALRQPTTDNTPRPAATIVNRIVAALSIGSALLVAVTRWELAAWAAGAMVFGGLALLAAVLFARSDVPAQRLRGLIRAWRDPVSFARTSRRQRNQSGP